MAFDPNINTQNLIANNYSWLKSITLATRSKAWTVFALSNTGIVGSNPTQGMDVCVRLFCVCVRSGLGTGWSPVQGVLPTVLGLRNLSKTKAFKDALCSKVGATGKRERERFLNHSIKCLRHNHKQRVMWLLSLTEYTRNEINRGYTMYPHKHKGKAIPVTDHGGPQGCETSRLPHFLDNRFTDGGEVVGRNPRKIPGTHFC
jgi:hypothetical protein